MTIREITPVKYWYENKYIAWEMCLFNGPKIQIAGVCNILLNQRLYFRLFETEHSKRKINEQALAKSWDIGSRTVQKSKIQSNIHTDLFKNDDLGDIFGLGEGGGGL